MVHIYEQIVYLQLMSNQKAFKKLQRDLSQRIARDLNINEDTSQWPRHLYELASKKISEKIDASHLISDSDRVNIGRNISHSTLERVLKYGYHIPINIDKRRLNTLNKLAIYLNHKDWEDFNKATQTSLSEIEVKQLIYKANKAEYNTYLHLPRVDTSALKKHFCAESPAFKKIKNIVLNLSEKKWTLKNHINTSYFELLKVEIINSSETEIHLTTNECWYLKWYNSETNEVEHLYNEHNDQLYVLAKIDGKWKIKTNHYPANFN